MTGKVGEALRAHIGQIETNRALTELVSDVPLPLGLSETERQQFDRTEVHEVFDALQFRVLRERLFETFPGDAESASGPEAVGAGAAGPAVRIAAPGEVAAWLADAGSPVAVSVRGTWGAGTGTVSALGLAAEPGDTLVVDLDGLGSADDSALAAWFADPSVGKVLHDANGPMLALGARGWPLRGLAGDTALAAYVVLPGQRSFDLADLVPRFLHRDLPTPTAQQDQLSLDGIVESEALEQVGIFARATLDLHEVLLTEVALRGGAGLLAEVELPLVSLLVDLETTGIAVDLDLLTELRGAVRQRGRGGSGRRPRHRRPRFQPRLSQAAPGGAVRRVGPAEDQADQDRLHHRRRRAQRPLCDDRAPGPGGAAEVP